MSYLLSLTLIINLFTACSYANPITNQPIVARDVKTICSHITKTTIVPNVFCPPPNLCNPDTSYIVTKSCATITTTPKPPKTSSTTKRPSSSRSTSVHAQTTTALPLPINPSTSWPVIITPPSVPEPSSIQVIRPSGYNCDKPDRFFTIQVITNLASLIPSQQVIVDIFDSSGLIGHWQGSCYPGGFSLNHACDWISDSKWQYPVLAPDIPGSGSAKGATFKVEHDGFDAFDEYLGDSVVLGSFGTGQSCAWQNLGNCTSKQGDGQFPGGPGHEPDPIASMNARCFQSGTVPGTIPTAASATALPSSVVNYVSAANAACSDATKICFGSSSFKSGSTPTLTVTGSCASAIQACATL